jgi:hypothetical protein
VIARAVAIASEICILFFISYLSYDESIPGRGGAERNRRGDSPTTPMAKILEVNTLVKLHICNISTDFELSG